MLKLKNKIILGSQSPRRRELLGSLQINFDVFSTDVDESYPSDIDSSQVAYFLSKKKNKIYRQHISDEILITADTVVIHEGIVLEKPKSPEEAIGFLKRLSNSIHDVTTGVTISDKTQLHSFSSTTQVKFRSLDDQEIAYYVSKFKPFDKAGAYGIQEWIGMVGVESLVGSFYNVMGLPTNMVYIHLKNYFQ